jgi:hypothetical protein
MRWLPWRSSGECMACCLSDVSACQPSLTWKDSESCGRVMYSVLCTWFQCCFQWAVCEILFSTWRVGIENMRFASLHSYLAYGNVIGAIPLAPKVTFFT